MALVLGPAATQSMLFPCQIAQAQGTKLTHISEIKVSAHGKSTNTSLAKASCVAKPNGAEKYTPLPLIGEGKLHGQRNRYVILLQGGTEELGIIMQFATVLYNCRS